jgi:hypothetical protein
MVFPDRSSIDSAVDRSGPSKVAGATEADDLERLQACVDWINHEKSILTGEPAPRRRALRLPRATQLPPVAGISTTSAAVAAPVPEIAVAQQKLPFRLAPPLASERFQEPHAIRRRRSNGGTPLLVVTAFAIVGSAAYYLSAQGYFSALEIAQASALLTP